jgi:hypothetical protein
MSKTLSNFFNEMASSSGVNDFNNRSREATWNLYYKNGDKELIFKDLGGEDHLRFYKVGKSTFYLTDDTDEYKGVIEVEYISNTVVKIEASGSKLQRGFYNIMFSCLFAYGIKEILSGNDLSGQAINSYIQLLNNGRLSINIFNTITKEYFTFSKELLLSNERLVISVKEKLNDSIKEHFEEYYKKIYKIDTINEKIYPSSFKFSFDNREKGLNNYLFGEDYTISEEQYNELANKYKKMNIN